MIKEKVFVSICCNIGNESLSDEMVGNMATGSEIHAFLMSDAGRFHDSKGKTIAGDSTIWYLGCRETSGCFIYENNISSWGVGESSFERVRLFIDMMYEDGLFTEEQYQSLVKKIQEGRHIGKMKNIKNHLLKSRKRSWFKERLKTAVFKRGAQLEGKSAL